MQVSSSHLDVACMVAREIGTPKPGSRIVSNLDAFEASDRDFNIPKASLPKVKCNNCRQRQVDWQKMQSF